MHPAHIDDWIKQDAKRRRSACGNQVDTRGRHVADYEIIVLEDREEDDARTERNAKRRRARDACLAAGVPAAEAQNLTAPSSGTRRQARPRGYS